MRKTRPIRIFWQDGVTQKQIRVAVKAINMLLKLANLEGKIEVQFSSEFINPTSHKDTDVESKFFGHYDAEKVLKDYSYLQKLNDYNEYYALVLMRDKIFLNTDEGVKTIAGAAITETGVSVVHVDYDFLFNFNRARILNVFCVVIHELGHIFNLPSEERKEEIELSPINKTRHCANKCVMYHTIKKTFYKKDLFCPTCLRELHEYLEKE